MNRVARLSATGALDTGFATAAFPVNNEVKALLLRSDGRLYVGGTFGTTLLLSTGARDTTFTGATSGQAFLLRSDGSLLVAGGNPYFSIVDGGSGAALKNYVSGHFLAVSSVAQQSDGKLLSGSYGVLKRTNPVTDLDDTGFLGFDNYINALAVDGAGRIWAGGAFGAYGTAARSRLAILNGGEFESQSGPVVDPLADFLANAGVPANLRGPNDDADNDDFDNLLEYALDLNPNGNGGAYSGTLPTSEQTPTQLSFTYRRVRNDVTYIVETSPTLIGGTWTSVGVTQGTPAQDGTTTASIPITPGSQFLRLSVSR